MYCERKYSGDVAAQPSGTLDTALPMALLQRLFQLEGQETLDLHAGNCPEQPISGSGRQWRGAGLEEGDPGARHLCVHCPGGVHSAASSTDLEVSVCGGLPTIHERGTIRAVRHPQPNVYDPKQPPK